MEIPEELLHPTLEELEERTRIDIGKKRRFRKRLGKREREQQKKEKEVAVAAPISSVSTVNSLGNLFVNNSKPAFSLAAANANTKAKPVLPTLRVGLPNKVISEEIPQTLPDKEIPAPPRKRGRPPKIKSL
ncbi:hypothetical protein AGMMS49938_14690 [Fibrobacterales bacterium]|nr:hypothetical protein AGMMS49938_14670 [Fibrobacterales bacterium]GHV15718.1 hypothetical protein AGMMS49938_14690 [Fibrobacterales bacterium]